MAMDDRNAVFLSMLDLSAAFDTINHDIMLERLIITHGLDETVIKFLESYLRGRTQRVMIDKCKSDPIKFEDGAVQG